MIDIENAAPAAPDAPPTTLVGIAGALDAGRERVAAARAKQSECERVANTRIAEIREENARREAAVQSEVDAEIATCQNETDSIIAAEQRAAKPLLALQAKLTEEAYGVMFRPAAGRQSPRAGRPPRTAAPRPKLHPDESRRVRAHAAERHLEGYDKPGPTRAAHREDYMAHGGYAGPDR